MTDQQEHAYPAPKQFINGAWRLGGNGIFGKVINPSTEEHLADIPCASQSDLDDALAAAEEAFHSWRVMSAQERGAILLRAAQYLREKVEPFAARMTLEQGKTIAESRLEILLSAETFDWYAAEGLRICGRVMASRVRGARQMVLPQPLGPVAAFTPWNFPALLPARKIAPALASGCTVILKPSEETPSSALALAEALAAAGLPDGVLNVVFGNPADVSRHLITSPVIRKVTFTGSTSVGRTLAHLAAEGVKPCTLELGGHAPVLVFDDADIERAVATCVVGKTRNAGQVCTSPTRFYVQERIRDEFTVALSTGFNAMTIGDGFAKGSQMGPLANRRRLEAIEELVEDAINTGAQLTAGGQRIGTSGYFYRPTVLVDTPVSARVMTTEPFGPVSLVTGFHSLEEGISLANDTAFGLAAYAFTRSAETAVAVSESLEAGGIGINSFAVSHIEAPFGGLKDSGYGHEGGIEGIDAYMHHKYIHHA